MSKTADPLYPNVRSGQYVMVESRVRCSQCKRASAVFAFALPAGYETLYVDDDTPDDESGTWESIGLAAILSFVDGLSEAVASRLRALTPHYRVDRDINTGESFWINHCEHCGAQMEEAELHDELDGPFGPTPYEGLESVRLHEVREPFEACAGGESTHLIPVNG